MIIEPGTLKSEMDEERRRKACECARAHYRANREKIIAYQKEYAKAHPELRREIHARYRDSHKDEINERRGADRARNREHYRRLSRESAARLRASDPVKALEKGRKWDAAHREERRSRACAYRIANPEAFAAAAALRRARIANATTGDIESVKAIYERAAGAAPVRCYLCGKLIPRWQRHVDHIVPLSRGGEHSAKNLAIACATCNISKHNKTPGEIGMLL